MDIVPFYQATGDIVMVNEVKPQLINIFCSSFKKTGRLTSSYRTRECKKLLSSKPNAATHSCLTMCTQKHPRISPV